MPRRKSVETCMFCLASPCECDGKKTKKSTVRRKLPSQDADTPDWTPGVDKPRAFFGSKKIHTDSAFQSAVQALAAEQMLHKDTLAEYKDMLEPNPPIEVRTRLIEWRKRNAAQPIARL